MEEICVYCADIGSVKQGRFGWARLVEGASGITGGAEIEALAEAVSRDLNADRPVAIGFECPLFVPVPRDGAALGSARPGEKNRAWSAGAGTGSMAMGLVEVPWLLRDVVARVKNPRGYLDWAEFERKGQGLFLWEAFVTAHAKGLTHQDDAAIGAQAFLDAVDDPPAHKAIVVDCEVLSLIGAAMLAAGWSADAELVRTPCLVIKAIAQEPEQQVVATPAKG